jgi:hypothetical protein
MRFFQIINSTSILDASILQQNRVVCARKTKRNVVSNQNTGPTLSKLTSESILIDETASVRIKSTEDIIHDEDPCSGV